MPLLLQHALILAGTAAWSTLVGVVVNRLLGRRLNRIELHVNGRMSALEAEVNKGGNGPRLEDGGDGTPDA